MMALDPLKTALDPAKLGAEPGELPGKASSLDALGEPLAAFLNPETGQATAVKPDPAGWPKAEVSPGLPFAEDEGGPDLITKALEQGGAAAPEAPAAPGPLPEAKLPDLPGLEVPKPMVQAPGAQPVQLNNPETGEVTKIAPDDVGWPKADVGQGMPEGLPELPDLPGKDLLEGKAPKAPDPAAPDLPKPELAKVELPDAPEVPSGAPKITQIEGLETGDVTTITPDSAGWPKADVKPGGLAKLPEGLPTDLPDQLAKKPPDAPKPPDLLDQVKDKI